jgi:hypothetical protein
VIREDLHTVGIIDRVCKYPPPEMELLQEDHVKVPIDLDATSANASNNPQ